MKQYRNFTLAELEQWHIDKMELAKLMGLKETDGCFDYSLPQHWLDNQTEIVSPSIEDPYDLIRSTTFWVYEKDQNFGHAVSGCTEIQQSIRG